MSTQRKGKWGPRGTGLNGHKLCYCGCGREVAGERRTSFDASCYRKWAEVHSPATVRRLVKERDHGVCATCGVDTEARARQAESERRLIFWLARRHADDLYARGELEMFPGFTPSQKKYAAYRIASGEAVHRFADTYSWAEHWTVEEMRARFGEFRSGSGHTWEADHIVPVVEGGGECGLENYRTLCLPCHRIATAALAKRLAARRREEATKQSLTLAL